MNINKRIAAAIGYASLCVGAVGAVANAQVVLPESDSASVTSETSIQVASADSTALPATLTPAPQPAARQNDTISDSAAVYATFQADVTDVKTNEFGSTGEIEASLRNLGGQNPSQLTNGFIAYTALVASQDPTFRASVRDIEGFYGRETMLLGLRNDVRYARSLEGGTSAVTSSLGAIEADSRRLRGAGAFVKEQAYTLQNSSWATRRFTAKSGILDYLSSGAGRPVSADLRAALSDSSIDTVLFQAGQTGAPSLWDGVSNAASAIRFPTFNIAYSGNTTRVASGREQVADQIATLAAYRVLGADSVPAGTVRLAMDERQTRNCIQTARLNLQQCVAAVRNTDEVPFCIGEHALTEVGDCMGEITQ